MSLVPIRSPILLVRAPQGATKEVEILRTPFAIGRKTDNDLCVEDVAVSGHHARIDQVQEVLFLEDLGSTNGTFINDQKIDRRQLHDADTIRVGAHCLTFRGNQLMPATSLPVDSRLTDSTIVVPDPYAGHRPAVQRVGVVEVLSGKTDQPHYRLINDASLIGAQDDAVITLTGWFAPKTAAVISRREDRYVIRPTETGKRILVNGQPVHCEHKLLNGDVVEVAGVTMRFLDRDPKLCSSPR
jgi:pSer/pThr/pTyr-binding forkhead associated (FHA) protein